MPAVDLYEVLDGKGGILKKTDPKVGRFHLGRPPPDVGAIAARDVHPLRFADVDEIVHIFKLNKDL
jgi:hypothetical protein